MRKFFLLFLVLAVSACGFEPINKTFNFNYHIKDITYSGDSKINLLLEKNFNRLQRNISSKNFYDLKFNTGTAREVKSKDSSGEVTGYKLSLSIDLIVSKNGKEIIKKVYSENVSYSNLSSKFELKQYENILTQDLVRKISLEIQNDLASIND